MADKHGDPIDFLAEGYKRAIDEVRGPIAKKRIFGPEPEFWAPKNIHFLIQSMI